MSSTRASDVAEILWELKRADKVATFSLIAERAGFSAGSNGRTMKTCMKNVRRDWPHLQWWRAINDNGVIEKQQEELLIESGFDVQTSTDQEDKLRIELESLSDQMMDWSKEADVDDSEE